MDENNCAVFHANQKEDKTSLRAEKGLVTNAKAAASAIHKQEKLNLNRHRQKPKAKSIACTEMTQLMLGFP